ncbi:hypothetical protein P9112_003807 [Eukaryota sp. TZLM1-RC]
MTTLALFYLGNYNQAVAEAQQTGDDAILHRSRLALGQVDLVLSDLSKSKDDDSRVLSAYARYLKSKDFQSSLDSISEVYTPLSLIVQSSIYIAEQNYDQSYSLLATTPHPECRFLLVHTLVAMKRDDVAHSIAQQMKSEHPDNILSLLARAYVAAAQENHQELSDLILDICDVYTVTSSMGLIDSPVLAQFMVLSLLLQGNTSKANEMIHLSQRKWPNNNSILWNAGTVAFHDGDVMKGIEERRRVSAVDGQCRLEVEEIASRVENVLSQ